MKLNEQICLEILERAGYRISSRIITAPSNRVTGIYLLSKIDYLCVKHGYGFNR